MTKYRIIQDARWVFHIEFRYKWRPFWSKHTKPSRIPFVEDIAVTYSTIEKAKYALEELKTTQCESTSKYPLVVHEK